MVVTQNAPPSAARGFFRSEPFFFVENLGFAQTFNKKTARSIRFLTRRSHVLIPHLKPYIKTKLLVFALASLARGGKCG
ncbi:MAG: hypothetical protein U5L45_02560 [Saprospiraceae bacterium]|nr:hypothetical protein [Saprospiraceae bacterium]